MHSSCWRRRRRGSPAFFLPGAPPGGAPTRCTCHGWKRNRGTAPTPPPKSRPRGAWDGWAARGAEALECLGGNGYVEESIAPRLYREAPLNSIWEGSGNVNALDVLRALSREPETAESFLAEVQLARGADRRLDAAAADLRRRLSSSEDTPAQARRGGGRMGLVHPGGHL